MYINTYIYICIYDLQTMLTTLHPTPAIPKWRKVIETLEKNAEKLFQWFSDNFLKANPEKCTFLTKISEKRQ